MTIFILKPFLVNVCVILAGFLAKMGQPNKTKPIGHINCSKKSGGKNCIERIVFYMPNFYYIKIKKKTVLNVNLGDKIVFSKRKN